jgi:hypothetical protein
MQTGTLLKLKTKHEDIIQYSLPLGEESVDLNPLIGKNIKLSFTGNIYCLDTGKKIKKSYGQGYSWESYNTLPECDSCIFQPELCHYAAGTCRDSEWGEKHCMQPHVVYLANSSQLKVGITRRTQVPTRWMDQGASFALPILEVKDRLTSGLLEIEIAKKMGDKTNWRKMLKNDIEDIDLEQKREQVLKEFAPLIKKYQAKVLDPEIYSFNYPVEQYPEKISSLSFDKKPIIEGKLLGIKGQYLILDCGVLNIRKHQGYEVSLEC